jgi:hypothetical protein
MHYKKQAQTFTGTACAVLAWQQALPTTAKPTAIMAQNKVAMLLCCCCVSDGDCAVGALQYNTPNVAADELVYISPQLFQHFWMFSMNPGMLQNFCMRHVWPQTKLQSCSAAACVLVTVQWVRCSTTQLILLQMC